MAIGLAAREAVRYRRSKIRTSKRMITAAHDGIDANYPRADIAPIITIAAPHHKERRSDNPTRVTGRSEVATDQFLNAATPLTTAIMGSNCARCDDPVTCG